MKNKPARSANKSRKTLSLSREAVIYLESYQVKKKEASLSSAVETLIEERKQQDEAEKLSAQTRVYYDSLPPIEQDESEVWGKFAESEAADSEA